MSIEAGTAIILVIAIFAAITLWKGIRVVPQQQAWIVERLGKFHSVLSPGLNILIPYIDNVSYKHSLKEEANNVQSQAAITKDNVTLTLDGVLYTRIIDPKQASYGIQDPYFALTQLAQTTMRSEIGKMTLDRTFEERDTLNTKIVSAINEAASTWGIQCMRYEIKDITPPHSILAAMEQQVTAEREKRALILDSEGKRQSQINIAEGAKQEVVLVSEAALTDQVNRAKGEAEAILTVAEATARGIERVADAIQKIGGEKAMALRVAEQYVSAFGKLAQEGTTVILPATANDIGSMVAQALTVFQTISKRTDGTSGPAVADIGRA